MDKKIILRIILLLILSFFVILLLIYRYTNKVEKDKILKEKHVIEAEEIFNAEMKKNTSDFCRWIFSNKNEITKYFLSETKEYWDIEVPADIIKILENTDFNKYTIFVCTKHEVREFSYQLKNQEYSFGSGKNLLDTAFSKQETQKLYIYRLSHANLRSWEFTKTAPPDTIFLD